MQGLRHGSASVERYRQRLILDVIHLTPCDKSRQSRHADMLTSAYLWGEFTFMTWVMERQLSWKLTRIWPRFDLNYTHILNRHGTCTQDHVWWNRTNVQAYAVHIRTFAIDHTSVCPLWWSFHLQLSCWSNFLFGSVWKLGIPHNGHQKIGKMNENDSIFSDKPWQSHFRVSQ